MGSGKWNDSDWKNYAATSGYDTKTTADLFKTTASVVRDKGLDPLVSPAGLVYRESLDSIDNPLSTPLIFGVDVTASMGHLAGALIKHGLNTLVTEIYDRKPVSDPHILCAAIGDIECDRAPFQLTQFEADIKILPQIETFFLEGGGGGNRYESYALAWYLAAFHTKTDSFDKRGKKGYLFTIGDERPTPRLTAHHLQALFGTGPQSDLTAVELLTLASRKWEIFHLVVEESPTARTLQSFDAWRELLGQHAISLTDHTKMAEVIVSTIQVCEGADRDHVSKSWDGSTSLVVGNAIKDLTARSKSDSAGLVAL